MNKENDMFCGIHGICPKDRKGCIQLQLHSKQSLGIQAEHSQFVPKIERYETHNAFYDKFPLIFLISGIAVIVSILIGTYLIHGKCLQTGYKTYVGGSRFGNTTFDIEVCTQYEK